MAERISGMGVLVFDSNIFMLPFADDQVLFEDKNDALFMVRKFDESVGNGVYRLLSITGI